MGQQVWAWEVLLIIRCFLIGSNAGLFICFGPQLTVLSAYSVLCDKEPLIGSDQQTICGWRMNWSLQHLGKCLYHPYNHTGLKIINFFYNYLLYIYYIYTIFIFKIFIVKIYWVLFLGRERVIVQCLKMFALHMVNLSSIPAASHMLNWSYQEWFLSLGPWIIFHHCWVLPHFKINFFIYI